MSVLKLLLLLLSLEAPEEVRDRERGEDWAGVGGEGLAGEAEDSRSEVAAPNGESGASRRSWSRHCSFFRAVLKKSEKWDRRSGLSCWR